MRQIGGVLFFVKKRNIGKTLIQRPKLSQFSDFYHN